MSNTVEVVGGNTVSKETKTPESNGFQKQEAAEHKSADAVIREMILSYRRDNVFTKLALSAQFENTTLTVIALNAIWIGIDVDNNDGEDKSLWNIYRIVENIFTLFFTGEIVIRLLSYKSLRAFFKDDIILAKWNVFDFVLVTMMVIENWVLYIITNGEADVGGLSVLRLLRLLRISRLIRMLPELRMMVKSMGAALRSVSSTMILAIGLMYVYAIVMTSWGKKNPTAEEHMGDGSYDDCCTAEWGSIGDSFLSLMQILVYDDTFALIRKTMHKDMFYGVLLIGFIVVGSFTMLNMLIGVIVEIVGETKTKEMEKILLYKIGGLFEQMDTDRSGTLSKLELEKHLDLFEQLGLEGPTMLLAFELADADFTGDLSIDEFVQMIMRLLHPPSSQDLLVMQANLAKICSKFDIRALDVPKQMGHPDEIYAKFLKSKNSAEMHGVGGADVEKMRAEIVYAEAELNRLKLKQQETEAQAPLEADKGGSADVTSASTGGQRVTE
jgi:voltage-gated sodium channel